MDRHDHRGVEELHLKFCDAMQMSQYSQVWRKSVRERAANHFA